MSGHSTQRDLGEPIPMGRGHPTEPLDDPAVTQVSDVGTSFMAILYGTVFGAGSAILVVVLALTWMGADAPTWQLATIFMAAWLVSSWLVSFQADQILTVFRRACGLGATEWLLLSLSGVGTSASASTRDAAAAAREAGLASSLSGGVATVMFWVCAFAFVFCWLVSVPSQPD